MMGSSINISDDDHTKTTFEKGHLNNKLVNKILICRDIYALAADKNQTYFFFNLFKIIKFIIIVKIQKFNIKFEYKT